MWASRKRPAPPLSGFPTSPSSARSIQPSPPAVGRAQTASLCRLRHSRRSCRRMACLTIRRLISKGTIATASTPSGGLERRNTSRLREHSGDSETFDDDQATAILSLLRDIGYQRFKLVNQG